MSSWAQIFYTADTDAASYAGLSQLRLGAKENLNREKVKHQGR